MSKTLGVIVLLFLSCGLVSGQGQVATGTPQFGSFAGGPFDTVNLGNLNVHFSIPVLHKAGRGLPFTYDLSYDSSIWTPSSSSGTTQWQPVYNWGWSGQTEISTGYLAFSISSSTCYIEVNHIQEPRSTHVWRTTFVYHDPWGRSHAFAGTTNSWVAVGGGSPSCPLGTNNGVTATTADGSGYTLTIGSAGGGTITTPNGTLITPPSNTAAGSGSATDSNGNEITVNTSGQFFDTLSSTIPALTVSTAALPTATTFTYPAPPDGAVSCNPISQCVSVTMNYQTYTVKTAFGVSGVEEYGPVSNPLVSSIQMPDGSSYTFTYESGPAGCTVLSGTVGCTTGRIHIVTLPSGGTITYTYTGGRNGIESDGSTAGLTRTLNPGGEWQYSRALQGSTAPGPGSAWTTTILDPNSNTTVINFAEDKAASFNLYETQPQIYQGSSLLLGTTIHCYNGNYSNCTSTAITSPITQVDAYTELPNGKTRLSELTYNSTYGILTGDKEYDYGVTLGSAPASTYLLSNESITYYAPNNGIASMVETVVTKDGSGNTKSSLGYTFDGTPVITSPGTPQHLPEGSVRGNLTSITMSTGNTTLYRQFTYYDTGMLNNSTDFSTSSSATCANTPAICTTYNYSSTAASCGNSFATSISEPMSLSVSMAWNCTGAVMTQTADPNNNATNYTYGDPNYWRVTETSNPDGGSTQTTYNLGTNSPWNIVTTIPKDSSTNVKSETVLDGFGRVSQTQSLSDPSGNPDYVVTTYDSIGRIASVSNPYQFTTDPTYGLTQYNYDVLNRVTAVTHPDSTEAQFSYTGAATQVTDEGNSSGSTHVQRVYQNDGLGRLTSVCEVSGATQLGSSNTPAACGQDIAANGFLTTYGYDALGNLTSVTQGSVTRSYTYDYLSRLTQEVNPEAGTTTYTYDTGTPGDLYQRTRPKPNQTGSSTVITTYTHDYQHRLTGISYNDGSTPSVTLNCDQSSVSGQSLSNYLGNLTSATAANGTASTIFSYDKMNRIAENWQCTPLNCGSGTFSLTFGHDYLGDVTSIANSKEGVTYTYTYDTLARLTELQSSLSDSNHPGTLLTLNTYNPLGEVTKATLGNGIVRTMGYDNRARMTSLTMAPFTVSPSAMRAIAIF
jgi:YD repeat-containing protein